MQRLREKGEKRIIKGRIMKNISEFDDWKKFMQKSKKHADMATKNKPDIVKMINEKERERKEVIRKNEEQEQEREKIRQKKIKEDGGEWEYIAEYDDYVWVGEGEPIESIKDDIPFTPLTKEELHEIRQQEEKLWAEERKEKKRLAKEKRKEKNEKIKEAMKKPIQGLPVQKMSKYEQIRLDIIKEREQAMAESGFFDDLLTLKKDIGLLK